MPDPDFKALHKELLRQGIAPRHAKRATGEMQDHYEDLVDEFRSGGRADSDARRDAALAFGKMDDLIAEMSARRELKTWAFRYPRIAIVFYPLACLAILPAAPVVAGVENASAVARWGASLLFAGLFTTGLLLVLQLSILFG